MTAEIEIAPATPAAAVAASLLALTGDDRRALLAAAAELEKLSFLQLADACERLQAPARAAEGVDMALAVFATDLLHEKFVALLTSEQRALYEQLFPGAVAGAAPARG